MGDIDGGWDGIDGEDGIGIGIGAIDGGRNGKDGIDGEDGIGIGIGDEAIMGEDGIITGDD
jgi:hypothetical protein